MMKNKNWKCALDGGTKKLFDDRCALCGHTKTQAERSERGYSTLHTYRTCPDKSNHHNHPIKNNACN